MPEMHRPKSRLFLEQNRLFSHPAFHFTFFHKTGKQTNNPIVKKTIRHATIHQVPNPQPPKHSST